MITRADIIAATVRVLGRRESTQIFGDHEEIGAEFADELGVADKSQYVLMRLGKRERPPLEIDMDDT